jgi:hypothetical protein
MGYVYNSPPEWPPPPPGWTPPPDWRPDPSWPPAQAGWNFWTYVPDRPAPSRGGVSTVRTKAGIGLGGWLALAGVVVSLVALVVGYLAWIHPDPANEVSSMNERASYLRQVDQMCSATGERLQGVSGTDYRTASQMLNELLQSWASLPLPRQADSSLVRPILDALEAMSLSLGEVQSWVEQGMADRAEDEFQRTIEHVASYRQSSRAYGLVVCPNVFNVE